MAKKEIEQTEIEAPYELPEGWKWCRLGEVADWGSGGTPSRKNPEYYQGSIPWIKTGELNETYIFDSEEKVSEDAIKHSSAKIFPKETVVMAMYGATIGKTAIFGIDASTNQACACAICHKELDNHFLFNFLKSKKDYFLYNAKGGAQPNISQEIIKNTLIPLPPTLAEQQRIVNRIESMFAKLDEAKEKAQNVVDGFEIRKAAILHKAFTGELTAKWRRENDVGDDSWEEKTIGEICKFIGGGTPDKTNQNYWNGNVHWASVKDIKGDKLFSTEDKITELGLKESSAKLAKIDDIILITRISPGKAIITKIETAVNQDLKIVETKEYKPFLKFFFDFSENEIKLLSSGTTVKGIKLEILNKLSILVPTLPEQVEIVRILDIIIEKENKAKQAAEAVLEQIDLLKKSILARAFRGEL